MQKDLDKNLLVIARVKSPFCSRMVPTNPIIVRMKIKRTAVKGTDSLSTT